MSYESAIRQLPSLAGFRISRKHFSPKGNAVLSKDALHRYSPWLYRVTRSMYLRFYFVYVLVVYARFCGASDSKVPAIYLLYLAFSRSPSRRAAFVNANSKTIDNLARSVSFDVKSKGRLARNIFQFVKLEHCNQAVVDSVENLLYKYTYNDVGRLAAERRLVARLILKNGESDPSLHESVRRALRASIGCDDGNLVNADRPNKIGYMSAAPIPTRAANCVHVMKMCNAIAKSECDILLVSEESGELNNYDDVYRFFNVDKFDIALINRESSNKNIDYEKFLRAAKAGCTQFFGRSISACFFSTIAGFPTILERHLPLPDNDIDIARLMFKQENFLRLIVITGNLYDHYLKNYPELEGKIEILPDSADNPNKLTPGKKLKLKRIDSTELQIGYAGHLYRGKGMEIISELACAMPEVAFHVAGGHAEDIEFWSQRVKFSNVVFYGHLSQPDLNSFLQQVDVGIAPYLGSVKVYGGRDAANWMSPLKIFEYMSHELPIVASDLPVIREVIRHEYNGFLCNVDDIQEWVEAVNALKQNPKRIRFIGENNYREFVEKYTWDQRARQVIKLFGT